MASAVLCIGCRRASVDGKRNLASLHPEEACSVMLDGNAKIQIGEGGQSGRECVPTGMCAMVTSCPPSELCGAEGSRFIEIGIVGRVVGTNSRCNLTVCVPYDPSSTRLPSESLIEPGGHLGDKGPWRQEYLCSGYAEAEYASGDVAAGTLRYPIVTATSGPVRWSGKSTLGKVGPVGGLVTGHFEYTGEDARGQKRHVQATFAVPRYPDKS